MTRTSCLIRGLLSASALAGLLMLSGCGTAPTRPINEPRDELPPVANTPATPKKTNPQTPGYVLKKGGGFYQDDGPGDNPPEDMAAIPDAIPRSEPLHKFANRPYTVLGKDYVPMLSAGNYKASGVASWYGKKFHGQKTSIGESYDMYGMTAAHPILPIPSYVRVSNPANGKSVVVRVNDRGPFHANRIIDLSYTAAWKLGIVGNGSGKVVVESIVGDGAAPAPIAPPPTSDDPIVRLAAQDNGEKPPLEGAPIAPTAGIFVQLGAFGSPENAEAFRGHIGRELDWVNDKLRTESAGKLHRVQVGPFASRAEAEGIASRIASALGVKPSIVVRP